MNILYPRFPAHQLPAMLRIAALGALIAGPYGALHDQVSFTISPEYFTKMKFDQFAGADLGWPPRVFASVVGLLATWWVGLIAGWVLARAGLAEMPRDRRRRPLIMAFSIVIGTAVACGAAAALLGAILTTGDLGDWQDVEAELGLELDDLRGFLIVAFLHWGGYLGALAGLIAAVIYVRRRRLTPAPP